MSTLAIPKIEETAKEQELAKEINALTVIPFQVIETEEAYIAGIGFLEQLKSKENAVHVLWDEDIETANKLHKSLTHKRSKFLAVIAAARSRIDSLLSSYRQRKEQERLDTERRLGEEARKQQQDNLLAEAAMLEKSGDILGAESVLAEAQNTPAPVVVAPSLVPKVSGSYVRQLPWQFEVINPEAVRDEYWCPDIDAIAGIVKTKGAQAEAIIGKGSIRVWRGEKTIVKK